MYESILRSKNVHQARCSRRVSQDSNSKERRMKNDVSMSIRALSIQCYALWSDERFRELSSVHQQNVSRISRYIHSRVHDDILTYIEENRKYESENEFMHEYIAQMKMILKKFRKYDLYVKLNKCNFHIREINFLKFLISCFDIHMQKSRVTAIRDWLESITHLQI